MYYAMRNPQKQIKAPWTSDRLGYGIQISHL